ncbi:hypothetical protein ACIPLC_19325 [Kitasatospora sp. NPDC086801]|uniref:hypothetical protein n=1 Tax=Kitasatospora sp. NPDC086801 TaxID=3364066 RepID=UPI003828EC7B
MAKLIVLLAAISVVFSMIAFNGGNAPIGVLFAVVAASPVLFLGYAVATRKRAAAGTARPLTPGQRKGRTIAVRVVALAMVGVLGYGVYWVIFEPKASDKALSRISDLDAGCAGNVARKYFPKTAAHTGAGPHPVAMFTVSESGSSHPAYPSTGSPDYWSGTHLDPYRVQLIACLDSPDEGEFLTDCTFTSDTLKLYRGVYEVTVYEARTGKKIGTEKLLGSTKPSCPGMVYLKKDVSKLHTEPEFTDYQQVLRKYVEQ